MILIGSFLKNLSGRNVKIVSEMRLLAGPESQGQRLDLFIVQNMEQVELTRSRVRTLIQAGHVLVNGAERKAGYLLHPNDSVTVQVPAPEPTELVPERVSFQVLYEDESLLVLSKPPGTVVHPACGHDTGTLVHGLLHHCDDLSGISGELRPGIVHRLDKDTSGVMVVAKSDQVHHSLVRQFKGRSVKKMYRAIVVGKLTPDDGRIDLPIGRHPVNRKKMAILEQGGREAVTHWRVLERFADEFTYVEVRLETGRTHQIRVHMAAIGHPVAGDSVYGRKKQTFEQYGISRQCLHSYCLSFTHPVTGKVLQVVAPLWPDMQKTLDLLREIISTGK